MNCLMSYSTKQIRNVSLAGLPGAGITTLFVALLLAGTPHVLGAAGESWLRALGGPEPALLLSSAALAGWIVIPLAIAAHIHARHDLS